MVLRIVNAVCGTRKSVKTIIIGDTTNLTVDINRFRKKYKREDLKDKDFKWVYSRSKGYYIGMKLVLAISLDKIHRFILLQKSLLLVSFWLALPFLWVSRIKEAYQGLLNGDILEGVIIVVVALSSRFVWCDYLCITWELFEQVLTFLPFSPFKP